MTGASRTVFVSGQVPWGDEDGAVPEDFESQRRMTWRNVLGDHRGADDHHRHDL